MAGGNTPTVVNKDEGIRPETTPASHAQLPPAFGAQGTITAGNASQLSDGAGAVLRLRVF
jgi:acetyl-CoA C-acetyltransferase